VGGSATPYAYDAAGDPTTVGANTQAFDAAGQLCWSSSTATQAGCAAPPAGVTTDGFNSSGDRTSATPATGTATTYGYDQTSRLTSFTGPAASATYTYDGDGLRMTKTVGGSTATFVWDNGSTPNILGDGSNTYLYGPDGLPIEQTGPAGTFWFVHDQVGSTLALLDATGHVAGTYTYSPFGLTTRSGTATTPMQYTGQYTDAESGLVYLRARYYDPATAQFLTLDPEVNSTHTPYAYTADNPVNLTDLTGLCWSGFGWACKALDVGRTVARYAVDVVAVVPYAVYYLSYYGAKGINWVGSQFGTPGSVVSHIIAAPLAIPESWGLLTDMSLDEFKRTTGLAPNEAVGDEGKRGYINPLHGALPGPLKGPQVYLPGCHANGGVDFEW
jgi:RHS repeat-associated protein